ncbi:hypothetical protein MANES_04G064350v8 [Manihot esculenta]|uniref:Uncharacterized protein n=1 Tax=Manihot esculenta TaxID=3983 RepID=A0ACB7HSJ2_MANES|nr:hypothetical protein MANES_04G064350v8 [Manihot esculenta]
MINEEKPFVMEFHSEKQEGDIQWVSPNYERLPDLCFNCSTVGHFNNFCPNPRVQSNLRIGRRIAYWSSIKVLSPRSRMVSQSNNQAPEQPMSACNKVLTLPLETTQCPLPILSLLPPSEP